jgi:SDR family mycofactocin-dependent oxidoreductase
MKDQIRGLLEGKTVLVTGGARGQGRAHAVTSAREGADVIAVDIAEQMDSVAYPMASEADLKETVSQVEALDRRAIGLIADVRSQEEIDAAVAQGISEFGKIDILIANAGIWSRGRFWELSDQAWDEMIAVNQTGVWKSSKAVAPHMIEREIGSIVITASVMGLKVGPNHAHYNTAKTALIGLMKSMALELAPFGIRCNAICPGAVNTPMINNQLEWDQFAGHEGGTEADMWKAGEDYSILKDMFFLSPQAIADAALYLNSGLGAALTGVALPVDAGHMLR